MAQFIYFVRVFRLVENETTGTEESPLLIDEDVGRPKANLLFTTRGREGDKGCDRDRQRERESEREREVERERGERERIQSTKTSNERNLDSKCDTEQQPPSTS